MQCYYVETLVVCNELWFYFATGPQGLYNVVDVVERGHVLPQSVSSWFNVSHLDNRDIAVEKILKRCSLHPHKKNKIAVEWKECFVLHKWWQCNRSSVIRKGIFIYSIPKYIPIVHINRELIRNTFNIRSKPWEYASHLSAKLAGFVFTAVGTVKLKISNGEPAVHKSWWLFGWLLLLFIISHASVPSDVWKLRMKN